MDINVKIKYLSNKIGNEIDPPSYATLGSAGLDLCAAIDADIVLKKGEMVLVPTGIAIALPDSGCVAYVFARSGLATKHGIMLSNGVGVIDSDYRGEVKVGLTNIGQSDYTIKCGDRIAQMVFSPVLHASFIVTDELNQTERGKGGFGSTGR